MSQSPLDVAATGAVLRYQQGWKALNRLLHLDRSFSGYERHCAFLNLGQGRWADVSAASGFDFPEDGRAVAATDWDWDGRPDLWVTNRTAPRVRLLRNQCAGENHFLAVRLEGNGTTSNRDAIGARLELSTSPDQPPQIRGTYAGDGFLSQSSAWVHFGLKDHGGPVKLTIRWPDGQRQQLDGLAPDRFYLIRQGSDAERIEPPVEDRGSRIAGRGDARVGIEDRGTGIEATRFPRPSPLDPQSSSLASRIVLPARLPLPALGGRADRTEPGSRGRVINLWASWCRPCIAELTEWTQQADKLRQARLDVVALCVDRLDETSGDPERAEQTLRRLDIPFVGQAASLPNGPVRQTGRTSRLPGGSVAHNGPVRQTGRTSLVADWATAQAVGRLDLFQRAMLDRWEPLSVPCTFLLDQRGDVAVIYKGRVSAEQLAADAELLDAPPERLRRAAVPFAGRWITPPGQPDPLRMVGQFIDHAEIRSGIDYLRQFVASRSLGNDDHTRRQLADTMRVLGILLEEQGKNEEALDAYRQAVAAWPDDVRMRTDLGQLAARLKRPDEAAEQWQAALELNPDDALLWTRLGMLHVQQQRFAPAVAALSQAVRLRPDDAAIRFQLGNALRRAGRMSEALDQYERAVELDQRLLSAVNNLAWIRATHPEAHYRNGVQAVELAERLCQATDRRNPTFLDTLAAAYAEVGRFDDAVATAGRALEILAGRPQKADDLTPDLRQRLALYQIGQPYRSGAN